MVFVKPAIYHGSGKEQVRFPRKKLCHEVDVSKSQIVFLLNTPKPKPNIWTRIKQVYKQIKSFIVYKYENILFKMRKR